MKIVTIQRDYGNRSDRKLARLKYTVDKYGVDWYKAELEKRTGFALEAPRPYAFTDRTERLRLATRITRVTGIIPFSWRTAGWWMTKNWPLRQPCWRWPRPERPISALPSTRSLILADMRKKDKAVINGILEKYRLTLHTDAASAIRRNSIACVALPTCGLALAESQRYLPSLLDRIEQLL